MRRRLAVIAALLALAGGIRADDDPRRFQIVVVKPGQTLWDISQHYLKDPARWDEIIKNNTLPSPDPTVALPGMSLRVPVDLIREELRAAMLVALVNEVSVRRSDAADWSSGKLGMQLNRDDTVRTAVSSEARVRFDNKDILELPANSMAVIKPKAKDYLVDLRGGGTFLGRSKIVTAAATITRQSSDAKYLATVDKDLRTTVRVATGKVVVEGAHKKVEVGGGLQTEVVLGAAPGSPTPIPDLPAFEKSLAAFESGKAKVQVAGLAPGQTAKYTGPEARLQELRIGQPISAYRLQISLSADFSTPLVDKTFDPDAPLDPGMNVPAGAVYRLVVIDLMGAQGKWSPPRVWDRK